MKLTGLLPLLPPYKGDDDIIVDRQDSYDIMDQVVRAHKLCKKDYDRIAPKFLNSNNLYEQLFYDCKDQLPYRAESKKDQTTRSPGGIITLAQTMGVDCKHYAGFIAGVIDAVSRIKGQPVDWVYRFASYDNDPTPQHVFVVVHDGPEEIWIDPTPIINKITGYRKQRSFNDRFTVPSHPPTDLKVKKMSLSHLSGIDMRQQVGANYVVDEPGTSRCGIDGVLSDVGGSYGAGVEEAANTLFSFLPEGDVKQFLDGFIKNPIGAIKSLITGRKYTIGDYQVGETFMRNIMGLTQVQNWRQVPDGNVPLGWVFFTTALGVRIRTIEDIHTLYNAAADGGGAQQYLSRNPEETHDLSLAAAERARAILTKMSSSIDNHDAQWPIGTFAAIPYIYPIPGVVQDSPNFTGTHPVTGQQFINGYPSDWQDVEYTNQLNQQVLRPAVTTPDRNPVDPVPSPGATLPAPPNPNPKPAAKQAGFGNVLGIGLLITAVGFGVSQMGKPKAGKKRKSVSGVSKNTKTALIVAGVGAAATIGYFVYQNISVVEKRKALVDWSMSTNDSPESKAAFTLIVSRLTDDEVKIVYEFIYKHIVPNVPINATEIEFKARLQAISDKYDIFT